MPLKKRGGDWKRRRMHEEIRQSFFAAQNRTGLAHFRTFFCGQKICFVFRETKTVPIFFCF